jgi:hypothetical protein
MGVLGQQASDMAQGSENIELFQAVRNPAMYRLGWMIDAFIWLLIGGSLFILGCILRLRFPIVATFITISGIAQLIGFLGTLIRLHGTLDLALAYSATSTDQQYAILNDYNDLWCVIKAHFHVPLLFSGLGYLLAARSYSTLKGFPQWLAAWLAIPGLLGLTQFVIIGFGWPKMDVLNYIGVGLGNIALNIAIAIVLWQPSKTLMGDLSTHSDNG